MYNDWNEYGNCEKTEEPENKPEYCQPDDSLSSFDRELSEHFVLEPGDMEKLNQLKKEAHDFAAYSQMEYLSGRASPVSLTGETDGNAVNPERVSVEQSLLVYNNAYRMKLEQLVSEWKNR